MVAYFILRLKYYDTPRDFRMGSRKVGMSVDLVNAFFINVFMTMVLSALAWWLTSRFEKKQAQGETAAKQTLASAK